MTILTPQQKNVKKVSAEQVLMTSLLLNKLRVLHWTLLPEEYLVTLNRITVCHFTAPGQLVMYPDPELWGCSQQEVTVKTKRNVRPSLTRKDV